MRRYKIKKCMIAAMVAVIVVQMPLAVKARDKVNGIELVYELTEPYEGDGSGKYVDTKVKLYDGSMEDFIVIACISNQLGNGDNVFFSCFSEEEPYRGLLLRNPAGDGFEVICGNVGKQVNYTGENAYFTIAIQKKGNIYSIFVNGEKYDTAEADITEPYEGNLLIGAQQDAQGKPFRFGNTTVNGLRVYKGTQSQSITAKTMEEMLDEVEVTSQASTAVLREHEKEESGVLDGIIAGIQKNGVGLFILAAGFLISCVVVLLLEKHKQGDNKGGE